MRTERRGRRGESSDRAGRRPDQQQQQPRQRSPASRSTGGDLPQIRGDLLYGRNAVAEALRGRRQPYRLFLASGIRNDAKVTAISEMARGATIPVIEIGREVLDKITNGSNHQGVALDASRFPYVETDREASGIMIALDHLQDPQNLGTLLRAAEACGAGLVLIPADRAAEVTPAVVNASAGAVEHLAISRVTNLARELDSHKEQGWWVVGLDQGNDSESLYEADIPMPAILVVGAEGKGISPNVRRRCDVIIRLPMEGKVESLNASTAGAVALFDLTFRHR